VCTAYFFLMVSAKIIGYFLELNVKVLVKVDIFFIAALMHSYFI